LLSNYYHICTPINNVKYVFIYIVPSHRHNVRFRTTVIRRGELTTEQPRRILKRLNSSFRHPSPATMRHRHHHRRYITCYSTPRTTTTTLHFGWVACMWAQHQRVDGGPAGEREGVVRGVRGSPVATRRCDAPPTVCSLLRTQQYARRPDRGKAHHSDDSPVAPEKRVSRQS